MKAGCRILITRRNADCVLSAELYAIAPIEREKRVQNCWKTAQTIARRFKGLEIDSAQWPTFIFLARSDEELRRIAREIRTRLTDILQAPLPPRAVDAALGITAQERLRWYKDGRLPICGRGRVGQGAHVVYHPLFPIDKIACILAAPQLIDSWRAADASASGPNPRERPGWTKTSF